MNSNEELIQHLKKTGALKSPALEKALFEVDRAIFVPKELQHRAYADNPLHVMKGQTISQPFVIVHALEALDLTEGHKVLEIGTCSGYQTALIAKLVGKNGKVVSIELIPELVAYAKKRLFNHKNVEIIHADASKEDFLPTKKLVSLLEHFDRLIINAQTLNFPIHLLVLLKDEGKIVLPYGSVEHQNLLLVDSRLKTKKVIIPVQFVPLKGAHE
ncbi:MAG: rRNA adenine N-6-methyltransferase family protein [Candidatus Micrarchaeota archaeon]